METKVLPSRHKGQARKVMIVGEGSTKPSSAPLLVLCLVPLLQTEPVSKPFKIEAQNQTTNGEGNKAVVL